MIDGEIKNTVNHEERISMPTFFIFYIIDSKLAKKFRRHILAILEG